MRNRIQKLTSTNVKKKELIFVSYLLGKFHQYIDGHKTRTSRTYKGALNGDV